MKKIVRFQHESGAAVACDFQDDLKKTLKKDPLLEKAVEALVGAHGTMSHNPLYSLGVDACDKTGLFVGFIRQPNQTDLFSGISFSEVACELGEFADALDVVEVDG